MTPRATPRLRLLLAGAAAAGVVLAHVVAFVIAEPDSHVRAELLASTGHRSWVLVSVVAIALLVGGLASLIWARVRATHPESALGVLVEAAPRLALLQVAVFLLLEAAERISTGHTIAQLASEPVVIIGVVAQICVALIGAAVIALLSRVVDAIVAVARRRMIRPRRILSPLPAIAHVPSNVHLAVGGLTLRGPPSF